MSMYGDIEGERQFDVDASRNEFDKDFIRDVGFDRELSKANAQDVRRSFLFDNDLCICNEPQYVQLLHSGMILRVNRDHPAHLPR